MTRISYQDIADLPEAKRIELIGHYCITHKKEATFITDDDEGKAERYIAKLLEKFPGLRVTGRGTGPVEGAVWVKIAPPEEKCPTTH